MIDRWVSKDLSFGYNEDKSERLTDNDSSSVHDWAGTGAADAIFKDGDAINVQSGRSAIPFWDDLIKRLEMLQINSAGTTDDSPIFISHSTWDDSRLCYQSVTAFLAAKKYNVFNPSLFFRSKTPDKGEMAKKAASAPVVIACLSPRFWRSKYCFAEVQGAARAGIPIIGVVA